MSPVCLCMYVLDVCVGRHVRTCTVITLTPVRMLITGGWATGSAGGCHICPACMTGTPREHCLQAQHVSNMSDVPFVRIWELNAKWHNYRSLVTDTCGGCSADINVIHIISYTHIYRERDVVLLVPIVLGRYCHVLVKYMLHTLTPNCHHYELFPFLIHIDLHFMPCMRLANKAPGPQIN